VVLAVCVALGTSAVDLEGGTTGTLSGTVLDEGGKPVVAATVVVGGLNMGAYSDTLGHYRILNIPSGTYSISFSRLGFEKTVVDNVVISADRTANLDVNLKETTLAMEEVVVTAERPPVDLNKTSSEVTLTAKEIDVLPVQNLDEVVNLQAGVVDGHFRGGRKNEVQYQVDGVTVNNAFDNQSTLVVDRSLLQEVQVINGTFDAEYGQAMSGVVNAVLKQGTSTFKGGGEIYLGGSTWEASSTAATTCPASRTRGSIPSASRATRRRSADPSRRTPPSCSAAGTPSSTTTSRRRSGFSPRTPPISRTRSSVPPAAGIPSRSGTPTPGRGPSRSPIPPSPRRS